MARIVLRFYGAQSPIDLPFTKADVLCPHGPVYFSYYQIARERIAKKPNA